MSVEVRELRYFLAVLDHGSITRAASRLNMAQPPLSQAITALERRLGEQLFVRTSRGVVPTPRALALRADAREILRRADRFGSTDVPSASSLRIGCIASVIGGALPQLLRGDRLAGPTVQELSLRDQLTALDRGEIDLGIARSRGEPGFVVDVLCEEPLYAAVPADHPLAESRAIELGSLRSERFVLFERASAPLAFDVIAAACTRAGFSPWIDQTASNDQVICGLVACGLGISIVPDSTTRMRPCGVRFLRIIDPLATSPIAVLRRPGVRWDDVVATLRRNADTIELAARESLRRT